LDSDIELCLRFLSIDVLQLEVEVREPARPIEGPKGFGFVLTDLAEVGFDESLGFRVLVGNVPKIRRVSEEQSTNQNQLFQTSERSQAHPSSPGPQPSASGLLSPFACGPPGERLGFFATSERKPANL
jgi:hypothetical protein